MKGILRELYPIGIFQTSLKKKLNTLHGFDLTYLQLRVNYYNKLSSSVKLSAKALRLSDLKLPEKGKVYYLDTVEHTRYYKQELKAHFAFGDVTHIPAEPAIVKSRPIAGNNANSVLMKLNKVRHFNFIKDDQPFKSKKDKLVWRGVTKAPHRVRFMEMYFNHPLCDLGKTNADGPHDEWSVGRLSINKHLDNKFILSIEGNDVASNLKWIMSSNSVAVMPKPKYETWFMEGTLIPDYHYIQIKDDYSDLEERLRYYLQNLEEAMQIVRNAHKYINQFKNKRREEILSLLVLEKYFAKTGQLIQMSSLKY